ncbi:hypothetical protein FQN57_006549 [Myotisia sp. PD_48]|nr:hypothetical protein FQN57_006549 [Myotisia sp. PD_48]
MEYDSYNTRTIGEAFTQPLPQISRTKPQAEYRKLSQPSRSTMMVHAPLFYIEEDAHPLLRLATQALSATGDQVKDNMMIEPCSAYRLGSEGDVSMASYLYLLNPVHLIFSEILRTLDKSFTCSSQVTEDRWKARTDLKWVIIDRDGKSRNLAVLEFKNTSTIAWNDFKSACTSGNKREMDMAADRARCGPGKGPFENEHTLLDNNAFYIAKQAKKYSQLVAPHVAVFDWDSMFIFDFSPLAYSRYHMHEKPPTGIFFNKDSHGEETFRNLLLGFLLRALKDDAINEQYPIPRYLERYSGISKNDVPNLTMRALNIGGLAGK